MKLCRPSGTRAVKSAANQAITTAIVAAIAHSISTIACGMSRKILKKTVRRERSRSSPPMSRTG